MSTDLYSIPLETIQGEGASLSPYKGKVLLIVNVASKCGLTPQYDGLEKIYARFREQGLEVLGFPANDFAGQEPGSNAEIASFCSSTFGVNFPMFSKIAVTGPSKHSLYSELIASKPESSGAGKAGFIDGLRKYGVTPNPEPEVLWNFEKFLVGRNGDVVARFSPDTLPDDPAIVDAIEKALAQR